jgi:hypothetical protein
MSFADVEKVDYVQGAHYDCHFLRIYLGYVLSV